MNRVEILNVVVLVVLLSSLVGVVYFVRLNSPPMVALECLVMVLFVTAHGLARAGHVLIAAMYINLLANGLILLVGFLIGGELVETAHLIAVFTAFLLFRRGEARWRLMALIATAITIPIAQGIWRHEPWLALSPAQQSATRLLMTVSVSLLSAVALASFVRARNSAMDALHGALDAAQAASRAKSEFLANMSHEIRTPMNGVLGMLGILMDTRLDSEQREYANTAHASALSLLDLINDILDLSKVESGQLALEAAPFDLCATVEDVADQAAVHAAQKDLELMVRYVPGTPRHVIGDPGRIRQILVNLVGNAIKFTDHGHALITVECKERHDDRAIVVIAVEDTGVGIPDSAHADIFDKFKQLDGSARRAHGGSGLGLAITRELVARMGGDIRVDSTPGQGSTFWITLPMDLDRDAGDQEAGGHGEVSRIVQGQPDELIGVRVLIVDDHPVNRWVLREQLDRWGMRHESCASAAEALERLRDARQQDNPYGIAIIDYQMPHMDGIELGRAIGDDPALRDTVLVMLTSVAHRLYADELTRAGFTGYLLKPVHQSDLMNMLATAWHERASRRSLPLLTRQVLRNTGERDEATALVHSARVLLVEDNPINQKVAMRMLVNLGCRVDLAGTGKEAIDMLSVIPYDLVFMDVQMPEMDGLEATAAIRARKGVAWARVPIIAMTAHAMVGDRERCLAAGMDGYVSKPVKVAELERVLRRHLPRVNGLASSTEPGPDR